MRRIVQIVLATFFLTVVTTGTEPVITVRQIDFMLRRIVPFPLKVH